MLAAYPPICAADRGGIMRSAETKCREALHGCIIAPTLKGISPIVSLQLAPQSPWHCLAGWWSGARGYRPCHWHHTQAADEPSTHAHTNTHPYKQKHAQLTHSYTEHMAPFFMFLVIGVEPCEGLF